MSRSKNRRRDKAKADAAKAAQPKVTIVNGRTRTETRNPPPADLDPDLHWYLVYTAPRAEAKVVKALGEAGCSVFWPSMHVTVTAPKRKPLEMDVGTFPRYLFAAGAVLQERTQDRVVEGNVVITTPMRPLDSLLDIKGVAEIVYGGPNHPLRVPSKVIAAIAGYQRGEVLPEPEPWLKEGGKALIIDGPFMGFQATIVDVLGLQTAKVLVALFGSEVPVTLEHRQLDAA